MPQARTTIALLHHVGGGNLGDDATLEAVAGGIKRRWPNVEIVALSMNPDDSKTRHGVMSLPIRRTRWTIGYKLAGAETALKDAVKALTRRYGIVFYLLKATTFVLRLPTEVFRELSFLMSSRRTIQSFDLLIISGGGQLTEKDGPWGFPYTIFKWVVLARFAGVRCVFLNVGAGPLAHPLSKYFVRQALRGADYVSLRDRKSQALVCEIGFTGKSRVFPDSAYGLEVATPNGSTPEGRPRSIVGFAPMPYPDPGRHAAESDRLLYEAFIRKLAAFASSLIGQSYTLMIFGTDIGVDPLATKDLQVALSAHHGVPPSRYSVSLCINSTHDLLATMSGMDYVVTCRFHGVVFAHLLNKPVLAIAHHPKVLDLMTDLDLSNYCLDIRTFSPALLAERFASMVIDADGIKRRMAARLTQNRRQLRHQFDELFPC